MGWEVVIGIQGTVLRTLNRWESKLLAQATLD